jgi:hypothetical protein
MREKEDKDLKKRTLDTVTFQKKIRKKSGTQTLTKPSFSPKTPSEGKTKTPQNSHLEKPQCALSVLVHNLTAPIVHAYVPLQNEGKTCQKTRRASLDIRFHFGVNHHKSENNKQQTTSTNNNNKQQHEEKNMKMKKKMRKRKKKRAGSAIEFDMGKRQQHNKKGRRRRKFQNSTPKNNKKHQITATANEKERYRAITRNFKNNSKEKNNTTLRERDRERENPYLSGAQTFVCCPKRRIQKIIIAVATMMGRGVIGRVNSIL